jgi:RNA polymerase sigma-70 factor (ECF subfamily)
MATGHESLSDERLSATAASARLADALGALSHEQRDVLFLHAWAQLSHDEIAAALTIPLGTVRSRLSRARSALVKRLEGFDFDLWEFSNAAALPTPERIEHD